MAAPYFNGSSMNRIHQMLLTIAMALAAAALFSIGPAATAGERPDTECLEKVRQFLREPAEKHVSKPECMGLGGLHLGATRASVESMLGPPDQIVQNRRLGQLTEGIFLFPRNDGKRKYEETDVLYVGQYDALRVLFFDDRVVALYSDGPLVPYSFLGLQIGADGKELTKLLGKPTGKSPLGDVLFYEPLFAEFDVEDGPVGFEIVSVDGLVSSCFTAIAKKSVTDPATGKLGFKLVDPFSMRGSEAVNCSFWHGPKSG